MVFELLEVLSKCVLTAVFLLTACSAQPQSSEDGRHDRIVRVVQRELGLDGGLQLVEVPAVDRLQVTELGQEPRQRLRYRFGWSRPLTVELVLDSRFTADMGEGRPAQFEGPPVLVRLQIGNRHTGAASEVAVPFRVIEARVLPVASLAAVARQSLEAEVRAVGQVRGVLLMDDRGWLKSIQWNRPKAEDAQVQRAAAKLAVQLRQLIVPFPPEAVGQGARWSVSRQFNSDGFRYGQLNAYRLDEVGDGFIGLFCESTRTAPAQPAGGPGLFGMEDPQLAAYRARGMFSGRLELDRLLPRVYLREVNELTVRFESAGRSRQFRSRIQTGLRVRPQ